MDASLINKIDDIYTSYNIYKAIFITNIEKINSLFHQLNEKDYPICTKEKVQQFNANQYRILLLDLPSYNEIKTIIDNTNVTTIINIGVFDQIDNIPNVNQIFL